MNANREFPKTSKSFYGFAKRELCFFALIIIFTVAGIEVHYHWVPLVKQHFGTADPKDLADYGESYVIFHSFFDLLAWTFVASALVLQLRDARERNDQFVKQIEAQRIQSVFFPYLTLFDNHVKSVSVGNFTGQSAFRTLRDSFKDASDVEIMIEANVNMLRHYHVHLRTLLTLIHSARIFHAEKNDYLKILHAQLSEAELAVIKGCRSFPVGKSLKLMVDEMYKDRLEVEFLMRF